MMVDTLNSTRIGPNNTVEGVFSLAVGENNTIPPNVVNVLTPGSTISTNYCMAVGQGNTVGGDSSSCFSGSGNLITGFNMSGTGINNRCRGAQSMVLGSNNLCLGYQCLAEGNGTATGRLVNDVIELPRAGIHILGDAGLARLGVVSQNFVDDTDNYSLQLAGGPFQGLDTESVPYGTGISAIMKTRVRGLHPEGEVISHRFTADGSAYSEYFMWGKDVWSNQNLVQKKLIKRVGLFVSLGRCEQKADKIFPAEHTCCVIGVTTVKPAVTGDSDELGWSSKVKKGDCGQGLTRKSFKESVMGYSHKCNPKERQEIQRIHNSHSKLEEDAYQSKVLTEVSESKVLSGQVKEEMSKLEPTSILEMKGENSTHRPRSLDPRWIPVALLGKVIVRDDGTCRPGRLCKVGKGGKATHSRACHRGWHVLRRISPCSVEILFK